MRFALLVAAVVAVQTAGAEPLASIPHEELEGLLPDAATIGILHPARGLAAFVVAGQPLFATFKLRTALTPPPGIQQDRALFGWEASLATTDHLAVPGAPPHRYPIRVSQIRPGGPTLTYHFRFEVPAWIPPDVYDLEVAGPGFRATRVLGVRVVDADRDRPIALFACAAGQGIPAGAWNALDVEAVVLSLDACPEVAIDPATLPAAALAVTHPAGVGRDVFRRLVGPARFAIDAGAHRILFADGDRAFADEERARATRDHRRATEIPARSAVAGKAVLLDHAGKAGPAFDPGAISLERSGLTVRVGAPAGVPVRFAVVTDGATWRVVGEGGPLRPLRVATAGPPAVPGVPEAAVLYYALTGTGTAATYRAVRDDVRPPIASLWVDGRRAGAAPHPARVGRTVSLEVKSDEAVSIVWDLGAETGETAVGPRASLRYRHVGRHSVTAVVLGERGNRRTLSADLEVAVGGRTGCAAAPTPNWTAAAALAMIPLVALRRGNSPRRLGRSRRRI